jgi:putative membrane protein
MHHLILPLAHLLLTGLSVLLVAKVLPGITVKSFGSAVLFALVVGVLNAVVWMLPITWGFAFLTLGLGVLVVNGVVFLIAGAIVKGVEISGCLTAILASVGVTFVNWAMHLVLGHWAP